MTDPYRDDSATLREENARLTRELARYKSRSHGGRIAAVLLGIDWVTTMVLRPWFNGASDVKFWLGTILVAVIALFALAAAFDLAPRRRS